MQRHRGLKPAAYMVGTTLILLPLFDALISVLPLRFADVRWRFGAAGLFANALLIPNTGLLVLLVTAIASGHVRFRRTLGFAALVGAALCAITIGTFALDAIQASPVQPGLSLSFKVASWSAIGKMLVETATLSVLGIVGIGDAGSKGARARERAPLIVSEPGVAQKAQ